MTSGGGALANEYSATTTFTMPKNAATVTATYGTPSVRLAQQNMPACQLRWRRCLLTGHWSVTLPGASDTTQVYTVIYDGAGNQVGQPVVIKKLMVKVTKIDAPLKKVSLQKGKSLALPYVIYNGKKVIKPALTWKSSKPTVAKVTQTSKITGRKAGKTTITATAVNGTKLSITVTVSAKALKLTKVTVTAPESLKVGATKKLSIKLDPAKATLTKITIKSSKASGLSVDKAGNLTAKKKGIYKITVKINNVTVVKTIKVT